MRPGRRTQVVWLLDAEIWLGVEAVMSANIPGGLMNELVQRRFQIICINCDALGIVFDCVEDAASSTLIKCRGCGAPRGTLGDLRQLELTNRDAFEI